MRPMNNKYVRFGIGLYGFWTTYLFVMVSMSKDTSSEGFHFRKILLNIVLGLGFNSGLFLVTTRWGLRHPKITLLIYSLTFIMVPQYFMLNDGIGVELHLAFTFVVFCLFLKGIKHAIATDIRP